MTQDEALAILITGANVFLTGEAGSGKSHTVSLYRDWCEKHGRKVAVSASTGIAATNIGGVTLHSWSGIGTRSRLLPGEAAKIVNGKAGDRIRSVHTLIIDEISMVSGALLNMIDKICRKARIDEPFGGLQVVLVGDFFQLPPVIRRDVGDKGAFKKGESPFAFRARAWQELNLAVCYLTEQHRQDDPEYLRVLTSIRNDCCKFFDPALRKRYIRGGCIPDGITRLYSHNVDVDDINKFELEKLCGAAKSFEMTVSGADFFVAALKKGCLSPECLELKVGALVLFTKNDKGGFFVNGSAGTVTGFDEESGCPIVQLKSGEPITVEPVDWNIEQVVEEEKSDNDAGEDEDVDEVKYVRKVIASISQIPLKLAWAITVHKSQGMTLDAATMDLSKCFEYGQGYVALSRVRTLDGVHLLGYNAKALRVHPEVLEKDKEFRAMSAGAGPHTDRELFCTAPVPCRIDQFVDINKSGCEVNSVSATCGRCGHETESYGTHEKSVTRCLVLLREECPRKETNYYIIGE